MRNKRWNLLFFPFCIFQSLIYFLFLIENWSQGGDPVIFKKLNDAYYKLIGHIQKVSIVNILKILRDNVTSLKIQVLTRSFDYLYLHIKML